MKKLSFFLVLFLALLATNVQAEQLGSKLKGKILLQVEQNGEAWYLSPANEKRYYMGRPGDAFQVMRELGIGIKNEDLNKIPANTDNLEDNGIDTDGDGHSDYDELKNGYNPNGSGKLKIDNNFAKTHAGKIFLQVEGSGEAWYVNPGDLKRYYLGKPVDAFRIMRNLGLGIKDNDLEQISKMTDVPSNKMLEDLKKQKNIKKFANVQEFSDFLEKQDISSNYAYYSMPMARATVMESADFSTNDSVAWSSNSSQVQSTTGLGSSKSTSDFSKTNIQVEGVDEADIIKTDGNYIYALVDKTLFIVDASPAKEAQIVSQIEFKDSPQNIYINNDRLVVFGRDSSYRDKELYTNFIRKKAFTFFKVFDISDRVNPKQVKDLNLEGYYSNSRMIGDYVYFVTNNYNYSYYEVEPTLPRIIDGDTVLKTSCAEARCFNPNIYYFDIPYSAYNVVSINAINIQDTSAEIKGDVYVLESGQNFYVSEKNIYLTYTKYLSEYQLMMEVSKEIILPRLSDKDKEKIKKIEASDDVVLSKREKQAKVFQIIGLYAQNLSEEKQELLEEEILVAVKKKYTDISKELEKTIIHKIAIDKGDLEYKNNTEVTGRVLNQFSMDESDGYFRIATTKGRTWSSLIDDKSRLSSNNLYVLDNNLKLVGALEGLAEDENIKSVRFMQNRAYMVTFKQIDPLFVIDLKDPLTPKVLGELKIPGYSDYLHPYGDDMLIGLGKDAYENEHGRTVTGGVKISLFDVSDFANPKEVDNYIMGESGSYSQALSDHKAFYFDLEKNLLAIPLRLVNKMDEKTYIQNNTFTGAYVFGVSEEGFEKKAEIAHSENNNSQKTYYNYNQGIKRILHIDDVLYTFSNQELKMNQISDFEEINNIKFNPEEEDIKVIPQPIIDNGFIMEMEE